MSDFIDYDVLDDPGFEAWDAGYYDIDPDDARDLAYEDAHDARYGNRGPDPEAAAAVQDRIAAHYQAMLDKVRAGE